MTNEELLRERVAKLEVQMTHLSEKLDDTHKKVEEMHAILLQAKGARWVIVGLAGVAGLASGVGGEVRSVTPEIGACHLPHHEGEITHKLHVPMPGMLDHVVIDIVEGDSRLRHIIEQVVEQDLDREHWQKWQEQHALAMENMFGLVRAQRRLPR